MELISGIMIRNGECHEREFPIILYQSATIDVIQDVVLTCYYSVYRVEGIGESNRNSYKVNNTM